MQFASWLRSLKTRLRLPRTHCSRPIHRNRRCRVVPALEVLEQRALPSAYVVTTTADNGPGSFRDAINQINADTSHALYASPSNSNVDEIDFNITAASDTGGGYNATTGVATITPQSQLPSISNSVIIDGYTQAGASANTLAVGDNAALKIDLSGALEPGGVIGLNITANGSTVEGLAVNGFTSAGIDLLGNGSTVVGSLIGTDITGEQAISNGVYGGVSVDGSGNTVGGATAAARNIISGNGDFAFAGGGVGIDGPNNVVQGNYIGTDVTGEYALGNGDGVVLRRGAVNNTVSGNVIAANYALAGVRLDGSQGPSQGLPITGNVVQDNFIGTDATGTQSIDPNGHSLGNGIGVFTDLANGNNILGNMIAGNNGLPPNSFGSGIELYASSNNLIQGNAIYQNSGNGVVLQSGASTPSSGNLVQGNSIYQNSVNASLGTNSGNGVFVFLTDGASNSNVVGGTAAGAGNLIWGNGSDGLLVRYGNGVSIRGNSIHDNAGLGIDLGGSGVPVPNDSQGHTGPNNFQDFPVLTSAVTNKAGITIIAGSFSSPSQPNTSLTVDFYANAAKDPSGYGQGQIYLGSLTFTTNASGAYTIRSFKPSASVPVGDYVTATATDPAGNTSEFGPDVQVTSPKTASHGNALTAASSGSGGTGTTGGTLVAEDLAVYVDNTNGYLTADELTRIQDAVTAVDAVTAPYGVAVQEVSDPTLADVTLNMDTTSTVGGYADGVLGCTTDAGQITLINGWNFYADSDATQIGSGQYDFETVVTHELGHALGLGHSADSTSVMYATLNTGTVNRTLTTADLNVPDTSTTGACGLHAAVVDVGRISNPSFVDSGRIGNQSHDDSRDLLFALVAAEGLPLSSRQLPASWTAGDAACANGMTEWSPTQNLALVESKNSSPIFAARPPREDDGWLDAPLFPDSNTDGQGDGTSMDRNSPDTADAALLDE